MKKYILILLATALMAPLATYAYEPATTDPQGIPTWVDQWRMQLSVEEEPAVIDDLHTLLKWAVPYPKPGPLSTSDLNAFKSALGYSELKPDAKCNLSPSAIAASEIVVSKADAAICNGRHQEIMWLASTQGLYLCENGKIAGAMKTSIGTNGLGKQAEGDRKNPVGSYWLGLPRASEKFGIFIPVGYPNAADVKAGRTGSAIGVHGPMRYSIWISACAVESSLSNNWTAGCTAVGRDTQIINIAKWVVKNWPVQLHVLTK